LAQQKGERGRDKKENISQYQFKIPYIFKGSIQFSKKKKKKKVVSIVRSPGQYANLDVHIAEALHFPGKKHI